MFPLMILVPLLLYGVPIYLVARWAIRVRQALESRPAADLPTREQVQQLIERMDGLSDDLDALRERQVFVERLLEAPRSPAPGSATPETAGIPD
jgi:hypothetical protein